MQQLIKLETKIASSKDSILLNGIHRNLYDNLANKYTFNARNETDQDLKRKKAAFLKALSSGNQLLEVGIGAGIMNKILGDCGFQTIGIDISNEMLKSAKKIHPKGGFEQGDFLEIDFGKKKFDCIIGQAFIHLFPNKIAKEILLKCTKLVNKNGILHLTTTKENQYEEGFLNKSDYETKGAIRYRVRYTKQRFIELLTDAGFVLIDYTEEKNQDGKTWMAITGIKTN